MELLLRCTQHWLADEYTLESQIPLFVHRDQKCWQGTYAVYRDFCIDGISERVSHERMYDVNHKQ
jgi:hypothetical protein